MLMETLVVDEEAVKRIKKIMKTLIKIIIFNLVLSNLLPVIAQDVTLVPYNDTIDLVSGFDDDPLFFSAIPVGSLDSSGLGNNCVGFVSGRPDFRVNYMSGEYPLNFAVVNLYETDTTLVINDPSGNWVCNDDFQLIDPAVSFDDPENGTYDVWIGRYDLDETSEEVALFVTEMDLETLYGMVADALSGISDEEPSSSVMIGESSSGVIEVVGSILTVIIFWVGILFVFNMIRAGGRAVKKAITGKEVYLGPAELKLVGDTVGDAGHKIYKLMFRGEIPNTRNMNISFAVSAFASTNETDNLRTLISVIDAAREPGTPAFGIVGDLGHVTTGSAYTDWIQLGAIIPDFVQPAQSGSGTITLLLRMFDSSSPPGIRGGYSDGKGDVILNLEAHFQHNFIEKGYEEEAKDREESQALSLKIAVAIAMADGSLDDTEGDLLKRWIVKEVSLFSESKQAELKLVFNNALKEAYADGQSNKLALTPLVDRLSIIGEKKAKYDAVELCLDVMAADGVADPEEMKIIRSIASSLELNMEEIEKMREKVTLSLSSSLTSEAGVESLVGIEEDWAVEEKKKHLRAEFQKWSNRLNTLPEGEERESAQEMLNTIAALRKKYG